MKDKVRGIICCNYRFHLILLEFPAITWMFLVICNTKSKTFTFSDSRTHALAIFQATRWRNLKIQLDLSYIHIQRFLIFTALRPWLVQLSWKCIFIIHVRTIAPNIGKIAVLADHREIVGGPNVVASHVFDKPGLKHWFPTFCLSTPYQRIFEMIMPSTITL